MEFMPKLNTRAKGHGLERRLRNLFISLGWTKCQTSRNESKLKDDAGIDLCYTDPFQIQAKAVENLGAIHPILARMPKEDDKINLVWHKKNNQGSIVAMSDEDFLKLITMLIDSGALQKYLTN